MFKGHKKSYHQFEVLIKHIISQIQDTLNAIKLKKSNLLELEALYVAFYSQKTYKLMKTFWNQNYETMSIEDIISFTSISYNYYYIIIKYINDGTTFMNGIKLLREIYLKKMLCNIQDVIKQILKNEKVLKSAQNNGTIIPHSFIKMIKEKFQLIQKYSKSKQLIL